MATVTVNSRDWDVRRASRGTASSTGPVLPGLPEEFLTSGSTVEEEVVLEPRPATREAGVGPGPIDVTCELAPGEAAVLVIRRPSGALTFHPPDETVRRTRGGPGVARFTVPPPPPSPAAASRGLITQAVKAIVVKVKDAVIDAAVGAALPVLARAFETFVWKQKGLAEGWLKVTQPALKARDLPAGRPTSTERSLLLVHGTFSNAASAFVSLADSDFFTQVAPVYGDRIFAFDHFTLGRTPEENARMLLEGLPDREFTFDVITHSRGGLVLRNLVERSKTFGPLGRRFRAGRVVLVASPNEGTPLATPRRFEDTIGWVANLLEVLPDHPFTTGPAFVANGIVWLARHITGDLPGLAAMNGDGDMIRELQGPPGPPADGYSALVANCNPTGQLARLLDIGLDQFFGSANDLVVPSEGGWRIDRSGSKFIPGARIGCFGQGGNLPGESVTHVNIFAQPGASAFLARALQGKAQPLAPIDPALTLPDRRLVRAGAPGVAAPAITPGMAPVAGLRARMRGAAGSRAEEERNPAQFTVTIVNGDLSFEPLPLFVGHYRSTQLTGTEAFIDRVTKQVLSRSLDLGVYPADPGTHQIFLNTFRDPGGDALTPRPEAVVVVGLGQEGTLRPGDLARSVRRAVLGWVQRVAERGVPPNTSLSLASTLMGSGGHGITAGQSALLIAQGIYEANQLLARKGSGLPIVGQLQLVELYTDRAGEAWRALRLQIESTPGRFALVEPIKAGTGPLLRPIDSGYRGADYDFIQVSTIRNKGAQPKIEYALDTRRARSEIRAQVTQARLIRNLVREASSAQSLDQEIGRTLYKLLIPVELEAFLTSSGETQLVLDRGTAGLPWELLDDGGRDEPPWAIRAKLLRKFKTETFRQQVKDPDSRAPILVIGEPACPPEYPPLPGAYKEAKAVFDTLSAAVPGVASRVEKVMADTETGPKPAARTVVNALLGEDWRVVHVAGHGALPASGHGPGGVVLSDGTFLGPQEIGAMRVVPELVFINCCHLGAFPADVLLYDRVGFASGVARTLIDMGVRCVIAAGWAVDDAAASDFATTFYKALLRRATFVNAVAEARAAAHRSGGNTWAAYQCYGDPAWTLMDQDDNWKPAGPPANEWETVVTIPGLKLVLRTIVAQCTYQRDHPYTAAQQRQRLQHLKERWLAMRWTAGQGIGELFAEAHAAAEDLAGAIAWYDVVIDASSGDCSIRAFEQRSNLRIRAAAAAVDAAQQAVLAARAAANGGARRAGARAGRRAQAARALRTAVARARRIIRAEDRQLSRLRAFGDTAERSNLRGAAMKRLAAVEEAAGSARAERAALTAMKKHYQTGLRLAREGDPSAVFYPASNVIVAQLALGERVDKALLVEARASLAAKEAAGPNFWTMAEHTNLALYEAIGARQLDKQRRRILLGYRDLHERAGAGTKWASVRDTALFALSRYTKRAGNTRRKEVAAAAAIVASFKADPPPPQGS